MPGITIVDLHCHSNFSDGIYTPEIIADKLSAARVVYASLADHDTTDGLARFKKTLAYKGIGFLIGLEISVSCPTGIGHLLAYGFDPNNPDLQYTLSVNRDLVHRSLGAVIIGKIKSLWLRSKPADAPKNSGLIPVAEAVDLIHYAGGGG